MRLLEAYTNETETTPSWGSRPGQKTIIRAVADHYADSFGVSQRNKNRCLPHKEQRYGSTIQWTACSMAFRTPTLLKSTDRQLGQRAENTSGARFRGASGGRGKRVAVALSGDGEFRLVATRPVMTAGVARRFDLLRRSKVRFREAHLASFARNLAFVTLR
jgi:hypothetical protein